MDIYLPIAQIPVNIFLILGLGLLTGFLAGMFGIGGGFLATPLLIFIGIPPAIAVPTAANQITASSLSGLLAHLRKDSVDIKMGLVLLIGGLFGAVIGVWIFGILQKTGQIDLSISLIYVLFLGFIGSIMFLDSLKYFLKNKFDINISKKNKELTQEKGFFYYLRSLPVKIHFPKSQITISVAAPILIGLLAGSLVSIMGIGGGFIMIPAMIYVLKMPPQIIVGTSLFQIIFIAGTVTFLQAATNNNVDIVLAFLMIISSVIGAQIGTRSAYKINANNLHGILSLIILAVCIKMGFGLFSTPINPFSIEMLK